MPPAAPGLPAAEEPFHSVAEALASEDPHFDLAAVLAGLPPEARAGRTDIERLSRVYESAATEKNTARMYRQRFRLFSAWCSTLGLSAVPAHPEVVRLYVLLLAREQLSLSTIDVTLAALAKAHRLLGLQPPYSERLQLALRGLRRRLGPLPEHAIPIPLPVMRQIVSGCVGESAFEQRDRALLLTAYFGGLRRCEVVGLLVERAHRTADGYLLHLGATKRVRSARPKPPTPVPLQADPVLCPVLALDAWIATRAKWTAHHPQSSPSEGPLFVALHELRNQRIAVGQVLVPWDVNRILMLRAAAAGITAPLSTQGLRVGSCEALGGTNRTQGS